MITFTILILLMAALVVALLLGGAGFLVVFADVFVCGAIVVFVVKKFIGK